jgi:hypothetical protein
MKPGYFGQLFASELACQKFSDEMSKGEGVDFDLSHQKLGLPLLACVIDWPLSPPVARL